MWLSCDELNLQLSSALRDFILSFSLLLSCLLHNCTVSFTLPAFIFGSKQQKNTVRDELVNLMEHLQLKSEIIVSGFGKDQQLKLKTSCLK